MNRRDFLKTTGTSVAFSPTALKPFPRVFVAGSFPADGLTGVRGFVRVDAIEQCEAVILASDGRLHGAQSPRNVYWARGFPQSARHLSTVRSSGHHFHFALQLSSSSGCMGLSHKLVAAGYVPSAVRAEIIAPLDQTLDSFLDCLDFAERSFALSPAQPRLPKRIRFAGGAYGSDVPAPLSISTARVAELSLTYHGQPEFSYAFRATERKDTMRRRIQFVVPDGLVDCNLTAPPFHYSFVRAVGKIPPPWIVDFLQNLNGEPDNPLQNSLQLWVGGLGNVDPKGLANEDWYGKLLEIASNIIPKES